MNDVSESAFNACGGAAAAMLGVADKLPVDAMIVQVSLVAPLDLAPHLDLGFELLEWNVCRWENVETQRVRFDAYFARVSDAAAFETELRNMLSLWEIPATWQIEQCELASEDWQESWKVHFHVLHVSPRVVIRPAWIPYVPEPHEQLVSLEPGMSFGTGQHFTTQSCIQFLDALASTSSPLSLFDAGCGSGILSIAAAKLGYAPIVSIDNDPHCVDMTRENAKRNHLAHNEIDVRLTQGDLRIADRRFDVVVANILATVLVDMREALADSVHESPHARLVLSGIMTSQAGSVEDAYGALGFRVLKRLVGGEWTTLLLGRCNIPN